LEVAEFGEELERVLPADGVPGTGAKHGGAPAVVFDLVALHGDAKAKGCLGVKGETITGAAAIYQEVQRPVKVVTATGIRVGDWLEVGGQLRAVEGVEQRGFNGPNGWVAVVLMHLQGWAIVQVPANSHLTIRR